VWPDHVDGSSQARVGEHEVEIETLLELRADEPVVRVTTSFVNPSRDHRLRVHLPLPEPAQTSQAESAFAVVERGLRAEGRPDELGLPTAPSRRFVSAGGLTVVHDGVCEYELIDIASTPRGDSAGTIALTVLRATGMLSRLGMAYRPFPAGPLTPVEGLQMTGRPITLHYALAVGHDDPYALADDILLPLEIVPALGGGTRAESGTELNVDGALVSAVRRESGVLEVRVFNPSSHATTVVVPGHAGWLVDLRGHPEQPFEGSFVLRPFGIATARLHSS
jgi:alpha-mannosidase